MSAFTLTPREIVAELDRYVISQNKAKKAVAIALRNRWRRMQVPKNLREEITPKNIIMIGSTGIGKTEIARRLAKLAGAPFIKVEASKFTEVGYVGKDAESMIRELVDLAVNMVRIDESKRVGNKAKEMAEERLLDLLIPSVSDEEKKSARENFRKMLNNGELKDREVELPMPDKPQLPPFEIVAASSIDEMSSNIKDMMGNMFGGSKKDRKMKVPQALEVLTAEEAEKLVETESVTNRAIELVEQNGIVFLDEIDKIASKSGEGRQGPDVSREGVQRDILPIVEGSTVMTKHGMVKTDHVLFIAAGAFHATKPADLIPELQGRFPIRVELHSLGEEEFRRILKEPENSLIKQYEALMRTEGLDLNFTDDSINELARLGTLINSKTEDIGARRLHTVMEKLLEDISFTAPEIKKKKIKIDGKMVNERLEDIAEDRDLSRYIL